MAGDTYRDALSLDDSERDQLARTRSPEWVGHPRWIGFQCEHEYGLSDQFHGRERDLRQLDTWAASGAEGPAVYCLCAPGGAGKSALAWYWIQRAVPELQRQHYRGAFWCSFYAQSFSFDAFLARLLRFVGGQSPHEPEMLPRSERERRVLDVLAREPFVLVLDGLERLTNAYATCSERAVDPDGIGRSRSERQPSRYERRLNDPRDGAFLAQLAAAGRLSKVLITTRQPLGDLERPTDGATLPGVVSSLLSGLDPDRIAELWRHVVVHEPLTKAAAEVLRRSGQHPLLASILARSVAAAGSWQRWVEAHDKWRPSDAASALEVRAHLLHVCLQGLGEAAHDVLGVLAASARPMSLEQITHVLWMSSVEAGDQRWASAELVERELARLVELGLVGITRGSDRAQYDSHPIVRGAAWNRISNRRELGLAQALTELLPAPEGAISIEHVDLNGATRSLRLLARAGQVDRAWEMYYQRLYLPLCRHVEPRTLIDLFRQLLPDDNVFQLLPIESRKEQGLAARVLGELLAETGDSARADKLLCWAGAIALQQEDFVGFLEAGRCRYWQMLYEGRLYEAECAYRRMKVGAVRASAAALGHHIDLMLGLILALRGKRKAALDHFSRTRPFGGEDRHWAQTAAEGYVFAGEPHEAIGLLRSLAPWQPAEGHHQHAWEQLTLGVALLQTGDHDAAWQELAACKHTASSFGYIIVECFALPYIAELELERGQLEAALETLDRYREIDRHNAYKPSAAEACRVRARCELARGARGAAIDAATSAYELAACDGPPFTAAGALARARQVLNDCNAPVPHVPSRVDPTWRELLASTERELAEAEAEASQRGRYRAAIEDVSRAAAEPAPSAEALALLNAASDDERAWWQHRLADVAPAVRFELARAIAARGLSLGRFAQILEATPQGSLELAFIEVERESLHDARGMRRVADLSPEDRREWLAATHEHGSALDHFLGLEMATRVAGTLTAHVFDDEGVAVFLRDNERRLGCEASDVQTYWQGLARTRPSRELLVLSECMLLEGVTCSEWLDEVVIGSERGIAGAFAGIRAKRAIAASRPPGTSSAAGWSELRVQLRVEDFKRKIRWGAARPEARRFWSELERSHTSRRVLRLAEALALREASVDDYLDAYVFSGSDDMHSNLCFIDYRRWRSQRWTPSAQWPDTLALDERPRARLDSSSWSEHQLGVCESLLLDRAGLEQATDSARDWWASLAARGSSRDLFRIVEELVLRAGSIQELFRSSVDGDTQHIPAALAYLEVTRTQHQERSQRFRNANLFSSAARNALEGERFDVAVDFYRTAVGIAPERPEGYQALAAAWLERTDTSPGEKLGSAEGVLRLWRERCPSAGWDEAWRGLELRQRLHRADGLPDGGLGKSAKVCAVVPIALEISGDLIPLYERLDGPGFTEVHHMRQRILEQTGVSLPGVRVRGNESDMPPASYLVMLEEVPWVFRQLPQGCVFTSLLQPVLEQRGVPIVARETSLWLAGAWVRAEHRQMLGDYAWTVEEFVARDLERIVFQSLHLFCGHDEVLLRLAGSSSSSARAIAANDQLLTAFTLALQRMLEEGLSTADFDELCAGIIEHWSDTVDVETAVSRLRLLPVVRARLPGNQRHRRLIPLDSRLDRELERSVEDGGGLHLEPTRTQAILGAVRALVDPGSPNWVLVTSSGRLRPWLRKLVELEFPLLHVTTPAELEPERMRALAHTLSA
jgi:tetratricopeptide (TPR) repeat protein